MFLTKKNTTYFNKPKYIDPTKARRILGGWAPDSQQKQDKIDYTQRQQIKQPKISSQNLLQGQEIEQTQQIQPEIVNKKQAKQIYYSNWDELNEKNDIECEKKLIQQIVQPGGIRIKPSQSQLSQFLKESKGMETHIVGSLLLSKIEANYRFQIKAKALYTIQFMVKKNEKYAAYFKAHSDKLNEFPEPEDNVDNYKKILKQTLNTIGITPTNESYQNEPQLTFVDPGYNDQPAKRQSDMKTFISQNAKKQKKLEPKRTIIGPGQSKKEPILPQNNADDILGLDLLGTGNTQQKNIQQNITFEQLMGGQSYNNNSTHNDLI